MNRLPVLFILLLSVFLSGCVISAENGGLHKAGLLLPHTMDDQGWNSKGYQGILAIHSSMEVDVLYEENIRSKEAIHNAVKEFDAGGVNLIFGHGNIYADAFMELKDDYPDIHFVSFNGEVAGENVTSLHFQGYSMGFFAGMLASRMSETNAVGVIGAFDWQPEVEGFEDGARFERSDVDVHVGFVESWIDVEGALDIYETMRADNVDVYYPAGDGYHVAVIEQVKADDAYAIGYIADQLDLGESTVLTSTVQRVDTLYETVASQFNSGDLESGNRYYDFMEGVIAMGEFSADVPGDVKDWLTEYVEIYTETGKLPFEVEDKE
ncbi:BMP family ABC transporter substrate-binding protein [Bacillus sp. H-16]|uniref:BMP family ABC transporter substrate-binding protein n=1 Tax=Alteribacter salitolerans TaxID=2912333 RepID=UPI001963D86B|nr:BMP family ABC transporter substrate-binding protein [Alteribacter salitolerans]MBM7096250.1 BMP family ABC transporter substrate-binding protein [Alteribacter salitolerans]